MAVQFKVYATPTSAKIFGKPVGDHTWVVTHQKGIGWSCPGGNDYYVGDGRWKTGKYVPPDDSRLLTTTDNSIARATCMGDPKEQNRSPIPKTSWPYSAGIWYAINGVCHQIANRVLWPTSATVAGANGYAYSSVAFGVYGTMIPPIAWAIPALWPILTAIEATVLVEWAYRTSHCKGVTDTEASDPGEFEASVMALHESVSDSPPATREARLEHHFHELDLLFEWKLGPARNLANIERVKQLFRDAYAKAPAETATPEAPDDLSSLLTPEVARSYNDATDEFFSKIADIIGTDSYRKVFDAEPGEYASMINPDLFHV